MRVSIRSFWPGIGMLALATLLFCLPSDKLPDEDWLGELNFDKFVHAGLFAALVALWGLPFVSRLQGDENNGAFTRALTYVVVLAVAYGIAIEFIQGAFIPGRSYSLADMIADAVGSGIGGWLVNKQRVRK